MNQQECKGVNESAEILLAENNPQSLNEQKADWPDKIHDRKQASQNAVFGK